MKRTLIIAILLPFVAYIPIITGGFLPVWLSVSVFVLGLIAGMISTIAHVLHVHSTSDVQFRSLLKITGFILYGIIIFSIIDLMLVLFASYSVVYGPSNDYLGLAAFVFYSFLVIPTCYILATTLLLLSTVKPKKPVKRRKRA